LLQFILGTYKQFFFFNSVNVFMLNFEIHLCCYFEVDIGKIKDRFGGMGIGLRVGRTAV